MISKNFTKLYCCDDITTIENYNKAVNDNTQVYDCHHKNEIELCKTKQELIQLGLYYKRPAEELIFLTHAEHVRLHGKNMSKAARAKLSNAKKGKHRSSETRAKISKSLKGRIISEEWRAKISTAHTEKPLPKYKWLTPTNDIIIMAKSPVIRYHPDWQLLSKIPIDPNEKV